jgi:hypothetical protein
MTLNLLLRYNASLSDTRVSARPNQASIALILQYSLGSETLNQILQ